MITAGKGMNKLRSEKKSIKKFLTLNLEKISFKLKLINYWFINLDCLSI